MNSKIAELHNGKRYEVLKEIKNLTFLKAENGAKMAVSNSKIKRFIEYSKPLKPLNFWGKFKRVIIASIIRKLLKIA